MELFLQAGQNYAFLIQLIVHYLKLADRKSVNLVYLSQGAIKAVQNKELALQIPSLVTEEGKVVTQIFEICKNLFEVLPQWRSFFLGQGDEATEIAEIKTHLKEGKELRKYLQKHLESRTFFVSNHITFADFFMFTQIYDNILEMTDEQKQQYNNLFRWYKHVQNLPQISDFLKSKNRFLVQDPAPKYAFLAEKKKGKKEKKDKVEVKKDEKEPVKKEENVAEAPSSEQKKEQPKKQAPVEQKKEPQNVPAQVPAEQ